MPKCKHKTIVDIGVAIDETVTIECQVLANPVNVRFEWWMESWPSSSLSNDSNNYNDGYSNNNHTADIKRMKVKTITSYTSVGLQSIAKYRTASQNDYGHLYCRATNLVGRQDKPCVFHIIKAGTYIIYIYIYLRTFFEYFFFNFSENKHSIW